jgi:5'-3' exonuclease
MGIPKFAKFLINRYPLIIKKIKNHEIDVCEIDNLYLDLNGVIHKRAHNNSLITACSERSNLDIFHDIFTYVDMLVHLIKPKGLLMISADGVAPRAKMNQQRSRRFRKVDTNPKEIEAMRKQGLDPEKMFNSDCISAGTEFMYELSKAFDAYINEKMKTDSMFANIKIILTGSDVPGEGEHKIVEYIRNYKNSPEYKPDTKHCVYGLDADLIMLSLITHEPNINILREETIRGGRPSPGESAKRELIKINDNFEFIYVSVLREYMELEFLEMKNKMKFEFNIERIIDDFVFFCFFIGNDFLPNLNTLDIEHGALDHIFDYYKEVLPQLDDYITYHGKIDFRKAEKIFQKLAKHEIQALKEMLNKVEAVSSERNKKKKKLMDDRIKVAKIKKANQKKEAYVLKMKQEKTLEEQVKFKQLRVRERINRLKKKYEEEMKKRGEKASVVGGVVTKVPAQGKTFEEDFEDYMKKELQRNIKLTQGENLSESDLSDSSRKKDSETDSSAGVGKGIKPAASGAGLLQLFDSDDEESKKKGSKREEDSLSYMKMKDVVSAPVDQLNYIFKSSAKYYNYIKDDKYCSDINVDDIEEEDLGYISPPEVRTDDIYDTTFTKDHADTQDLDKVFQQKLIEYYINDVNKAKAFYYKEKVGIDIETQEGQKEHKNLIRQYLIGTQWVLYYYYRGIQAWRWFYPYHYAPMISDFKEVKEIIEEEMSKFEISFDKSKPYTPFQSLLFILPKKSRALVPQCYWNLYDEFKDLYPEKFGIDFNGKKMPWESIVLLPFIDDKVIIEFEERCRKQSLSEEVDKKLNYVLTDRDLERNLHGQSYIYYNKESNKLNQTPTKDIYEVYCDTTNTNLDSNYSSKTVDYKFPTLKTIKYNYFIDFRKEYTKSRVPRTSKVMAMRPVLEIDMKTLDKHLRDILHKGVIYVNYPFKEEGCIRGIFYNNKYFYYDNFKGKTAIDGNFRISQETREFVKKQWWKKGIILDDVYQTVLVDVFPLKLVARDNTGCLLKIYEEESFLVPFELTSLNSHYLSSNNDFTKIEKDCISRFNLYKSLNTEYHPQDDVVVFSKCCFGASGKIKTIIDYNHKNYKEYNNDNYEKHYDGNVNYDLDDQDWKADLDSLYKGELLEVEVCPKSQNLNKSIKLDPYFAKNVIQSSKEEYFTSEEIAKELNIPSWILGMLTASLYVINCTPEDEIDEDTRLSEMEHWNIGLNLKTRARGQKLVLPGYTRCIESNKGFNRDQFEFSTAAVEILKEYKQKFPFVFESLEKYKTLYHRSSKFFKIYELFSSVDGIETKMSDILTWINGLPISKQQFATHLSEFLSVNDCKKLEKYVENKLEILQQNQNINSEKSAVHVLNPAYAFKESSPYVPPFIGYEPYPFALGDRVVNIRSNDIMYIPFGLTGTVTAVSMDYIEVLFDEEFITGETRGGRFKFRKGALVKPINLINLTNKPPIYLRRNNQKHFSWNFSYPYEQYEGLLHQSYGTHKLYDNSLARKTSETIRRKNNQGNQLPTQVEGGQSGIEFIRTKSQENVPSQQFQQNKKIFQKNEKQSNLIPQYQNVYDNNSGYGNKFNNNYNNNYYYQQKQYANYTDQYSNQQTPYSGKLSSEAQSFIPRKIIIKELPKLHSDFKTYPEGLKVETKIEEIGEINASIYAKNRRFESEKGLPENSVYLYSTQPLNKEIESNKNLIIKK